MQNKKPTLQDVASAANVSTATISRCLNQPEKVRPAVQQRIMQAINALGYVPHGAARALASQRTRTIGAIVPTIDNMIFAEAIQHLQRGLTAAQYTLLLASSSYSPDEELAEVQSLLSRGIDGLVLVGEHHHPEVFTALERQRIPHVNLWIYNATSTHSCIGFDHIKAGGQLAEHLLSLGHRDIAAISGILNGNDRAAQRLQGVKDALAAHGVDLPQQRIIQQYYSVEHGRLALHQLLKQDQGISAVVCGNDILALGALCAAREAGLQVPQDLSITGFDNIDIIQAVVPQLTTINAPSRRMGARAAEYLLQQITTPSPQVQRIELDAELVIRATTGPARVRKLS